MLLYDGNCALCHRLVRLVLRHDHARAFRFAPLQGTFGTAVLARHGKRAGARDTAWLWVPGGAGDERLFDRSDAALETLRRLGAGWRLLAALGALVPRAWRDRGYDLIAARRYRWFGELAGCPLPSPGQRDRFIE